MIEPAAITKILRQLQAAYNIPEHDAGDILFACWELNDELRQTQTAEELKLQCFQYAARLERSKLLRMRI